MERRGHTSWESRLGKPGWTATGHALHAASQLLPGRGDHRGDHLSRPQAPGLSNAMDTHVTESCSGTVTSQMLGSGDDHTPKVTFRKIRIGARKVGKRDDSMPPIAARLPWGRRYRAQAWKKVTQRGSSLSFWGSFEEAERPPPHPTCQEKFRMTPF